VTRLAAAPGRSTVAAALLAAASMLLAACPGDSPRPHASPGASSPIPTTPPQGEIRVAWPHEPATLNPLGRGGEAPSARALVRSLWPPLFTSDGQPWLVDRVVSEEPRSVRFTLRDDAVWSDGVPIKASDVAFTWKTITDPNAPIVTRSGYDAISSVEAEGPKIARLTFSRDVPAWRDLFSAGLGVLPEHALSGRDLAAALRSDWPVSGGPFVLARYTRGLEMVLEATPMPWRVRARAKTIRVMFVPDSTTAIQMLRAGRVDVLGPYSSPDFARRAGEEEGAAVSTDVGGVWTGLVFNAKASITSDQRVRRAAAHAIDVDAIAAGLVRQEGERLSRPFAYPQIDHAGITHDPAQAARLLDEAGFTGRRGGVRTKGSTELEISIASTGSDDLTQRVVRAVFAHLKAAGFAVNLVSLEDEALWRDWLPSTRFQAAIVTFADPPGGALRDRYHSGQVMPAGVNIARIADPALDATVEAGDAPSAATELDRLAVVIPLWRASVPAVARRGVGGVRAVASADGMLAVAHDWSL